MKLTQQQIEWLRMQVRSTRNASVLKRALAYLELGLGKLGLEVEAMLQVSLRTLYRWTEELERRVAHATLFGSVMGA